MQTDRLAHRRSDARGKPVCAACFVAIVNALGGRCFAERVNHVTDIVQQRRHDHARRLTLVLGQVTAMRERNNALARRAHGDRCGDIAHGLLSAIGGVQQGGDAMSSRPMAEKASNAWRRRALNGSELAVAR